MKITSYQQVWPIWLAHRAALEKYVLKHTNCKELAHDITQDVLLKVHKTCCSEVDIKNIRSWLFQITYRTIIDVYRRQQRAPSEWPLAEEEVDAYQALATYIEPLLSFLPAKYSIPLQMADVEKMKQEEVARALNISLSAVKSRIQRARKLLRAEINCCFHLETCTDSGLTDFQLKESCQPLKEWEKKNAENLASF
ncbi:MAG: sigma-70 family RNA polymerase sigma factor [Bacteroidota bacterium]